MTCQGRQISFSLTFVPLVKNIFSSEIWTQDVVWFSKLVIWRKKMYMLRQIIRQVFSDQLLSLITQLFIYNLGHDNKMSTLQFLLHIFMIAIIYTNRIDPVLPLLTNWYAEKLYLNFIDFSTCICWTNQEIKPHNY